MHDYDPLYHTIDNNYDVVYTQHFYPVAPKSWTLTLGFIAYLICYESKVNKVPFLKQTHPFLICNKHR